jgi:hypothetical protein
MEAKSHHGGTETRRRADSNYYDFKFRFDMSNSPLCSFVSSVVNGFSDLIFGNSWRIGVKA